MYLCASIEGNTLVRTTVLVCYSVCGRQPVKRGLIHIHIEIQQEEVASSIQFSQAGRSRIVIERNGCFIFPSEICWF